MAKLLRGGALRNRAEKLGLVFERNLEQFDDDRGSYIAPGTPEDKLQRRVMEAERHQRESRLWIVAVVSMIISLLSAFAAWLAVLTR